MATVSTTIQLVDNMTTKLTDIKNGLNDVIDTMEGIQNKSNGVSWDTFIANAEKAGKKMTDIGKKMTVAISTPLALLGKKAYGNAVDYESAYVGMKKTVDGTEAQYERLYQVALEISETTPTGFVEAMNIMQMGGNLGVKVDDMETFTRAYTALVAASDQHISGDEGAKSVANFLNIMDGGVQDIERFGSTVVHLGNNYNALEDGILDMAVRMASAGKLAGFSTPQVLGMATAFSAVGIGAEAGGSAASKLIKQFQLAAEVGGTAQDTFGGTYDSAVEFFNAMQTKDNLLEVADQMGMTTEQVKSMADAWYSLEQFANVSGKSTEQFISDWSKDPASGMVDFFNGLANLDATGVESVLTTLDKMGIKEVRESNLVAAMASNPEMFASAVAAAMAAYGENTAMWDEFSTMVGTQESQNTILQNKLDNSMADFGDNIVKAVQPALDKLNELLTAFNNLSEVDQDKLVTLMGALIITGPALTALGTMVTGVGKIAKGIQTLSKSQTAIKVLDGLKNFLTTPVGQVLAVAGAVALIAEAIDAIPTKAEQIAEDLKDIPITLDQASYDQTMAAIAELQAKIAELKGNPEEMATLANTSAAVKMGYGTNTMYGNALTYEAAMAEDEYTQIVNDYTARIREAEANIVNAQTDAERETWKNTAERLQGEMDAATSAAKQRYADNISELYNGMISQYPELAARMERASKEYDLMGFLQQAYNFNDYQYTDAYKAMTGAQQEAYDAQKLTEWNTLMKGMYAQAFDLGYMEDSGMTLDQIFANVDAGNIIHVGWMDVLNGLVLDGLKDSNQTISDNPIAMSYLQTILDNPALMENLDSTKIQGAMDGIYKALDWRSAMQQATEVGDPNLYGQYLTQGLADGIAANTSAATTAATGVGTSTCESLAASLGEQSPSVIAHQDGVYLGQGLGNGIAAGQSIATMAAAAMGAAVMVEISSTCNQTTATANAILSFGAGSGIGANMVAGLAAGILARKAAAVSAARQVAAAAAAAMRSALQIHSPSKLTGSYGEYFTEGFAGGILAQLDTAERAVVKVSEASSKALKDSVWSLIGSYNTLENTQMQDEDTEVKISEADLKKVRTLAEREIINQFTTAELKVEFTAENHIDSKLDLDDVVTYLEDKVSERLEVVAGGVYE